MVEISQLRKVNLNRLPVLWELLRCRNVSIAASNLGLTQSTVSAALKDLREQFDDELLVSSGRELVLTDRAQELVPRLQAILDLAGDMVCDQTYDPAIDRGAFRIATADYVSTLLLPELADALAARAPHAMVQILHPSLKVTNDLKLDIVDLIIGPEQMVDWIGARGQEQYYYMESCFADSLVGICRTGEAQGLADLQTYLTRPHAAVHIHRELPASLEHDVLISRQMKQDNRFLVPDFGMLPMLVDRAGLISVVPKSLAARYVSLYAIETFDPPVPFPPLTLTLLWARGREKDLRLRWFLDRVREAFRRLQAEA
jgi:DNA-binding transcriptional LysR family regulator